MASADISVGDRSIKGVSFAPAVFPGIYRSGSGDAPFGFFSRLDGHCFWSFFRRFGHLERFSYRLEDRVISHALFDGLSDRLLNSLDRLVVLLFFVCHCLSPISRYSVWHFALSRCCPCPD